MGDEDSQYKVEYLDAEDAPDEERLFTWVARAGRAKVTYDSGNSYEGCFNDEKQKHGLGKFVWMKPAEDDEEAKVLATYEGEYKDGKKEGQGSMTYPSGDAFSGTWKADKMHGVGLYKYKKTGDIYSGEYADGLKAGKGTYEFGKDSSRLDGVWEAGQFKTGDWQFKDAGSYAGGFDQGQPAGAGAFHFFTAGGVKITQKGEYKAAVSPDPEAEVDADAEPAVRTWHGIPVYAN